MAPRLNGVLASIRAGLARLAGLVRGSRRDREFADEIETHLQLHIDDLTRAGLAPDRARRQARLKLGGIEAIRETYRDRRGIPVIDRLAQDVRDAVRVLRRSPGFAGVAILSLALGIGANTAIFSIVSAVMIRPLPVPEAGRLVQLSPGTNRDNWSRPLWEQIRDRPELFDGVFAWSESSLNLAERGEVRPARAILAGGSFFETLRVVPIKGRLLLPSDDVRGGGPEGAVAVISYRFWQDELGGAADVVGRGVALNRVTFTVVGVTAPDFFGPRVGRAFDVVVPMGALTLLRPDATAMLNSRTTWWLSVMARLRPDQTMASAASSLVAVSPVVRQATLPPTYGPEALANYLKGGIQVRSAPGGPAGLQRTYERPLFVLLGVTGMVLLLCCVNIANLLLARSAARRHEVAVRLALGASRWRLIQQLLVESLILAVAGALIALAIARAGSGWLVQQLSTTANAIHLDLAIDWRVLLFTTLVAVGVAVLFGCVPALRASDARPTDALRDSTRIVRGEARFGFGSALVVVQVALSLVLVVAAGLFVRTFTSLAQKPLGFDRDPVLIVSVNAQRSAVSAADRGALFERVRQAAASVPGVASAALAAIVPVTNTQIDRPIQNPDGMSLDEQQRSAFWNYVSHDWFATYGVPLRSGRDFGPLDAAPAPQTIVVNETFARRFFPGVNPIGRTVRVEPGPGEANPPMTIVGVVGDAVYDSLRDTIPPTIYQSVSQAGMASSIALSVRASASAPASLGPAISQAIMAVDNDLSLTLRVLGDQIDASIARERVLARLSAVFGAVGLLLAAIGLFGVMSHAVARRRAEIGLRMSLGATPAAIVGLVARRVFILVAAGVAAGSVLSVWTAGLVEALLFDVAPGSPLVLAGAIGVLGLVAGAASAVPAWRAAHVDPTTALRGS